jgi:DnaJ domain
MTTVAGVSVRLGGGGSLLRLSGDSPRPRHLPFRTWAAVQGRERSRTSSLTFYELLGITTRDGLEEVKKAYKRMARKYHPDVSPPDCTEEHTRLFIEVQEAYETLSDSYRRADYDKQLARGLTRLAFTARNRHHDPVQFTGSSRLNLEKT